MNAILATLFGLVTTARNQLYDWGVLPSYRSPLPVICIGNLTVGGNGKTPLVMQVVQILRQRNLRVAIVMRGYGGKKRGPYRVEVGDDPAEVGDEALLLRQELNIPVVVSRRRSRGIKLLEQDRCDVVVLDDGLQHRAVAPTLTIATHFLGDDASVAAFLAGKLLPEGRFREDRARALRRIDCLVFASRSLEAVSIPDSVREMVPPRVQVCSSRVTVTGLRCATSGELMSDPLANRKWIAVCGIANPQGFLTTLRSYGIYPDATYEFGDHVRFSASKVRQLEQQHSDASFVCTTKDMVKLKPLVSRDWFQLCTHTVVEPGEVFEGMLSQAVSQSSAYAERSP